ncbi:MAG: alcohol dehydrogenase catalytic domain-containing protein [Deinococcales bacterium]
MKRLMMRVIPIRDEIKHILILTTHHVLLKETPCWQQDFMKPRDLRLDTLEQTPAPKAGEVQIRIKTVGICGSDLHTYHDGRIGDTVVSSPLILGHEFSGMVTTVGEGALDGEGHPLKEGQLIAVDPAVPCWRCEVCEHGHPNLCPHHYFLGLYPRDGALRESMNVVARGCFGLPEWMDGEVGALSSPWVSPSAIRPR